MNVNKSELFGRTELLLGKEAMEKIYGTHVAIFGVGGVGGYALEGLVRSGVGHITVIDSDNVSLSNINRQIIATIKTVGTPKVEAALMRAKEINPHVQIDAQNIFFSAESADRIDFSKFDYIVDAIDTVSSKLLLIERANELKVPIISSMGAGNKLDPTAFEVSDIYKTSVCPLARVMRTELKKRGIKKLKVVYSKEEPIKAVVSENDNDTNTEKTKITRHAPGSISFVPSVVGLIIAGEVIKDVIA